MTKLPQGIGPAMMAIACGSLDGDEKKVRAWIRVLALAMDRAGETALAQYFAKLLDRQPDDPLPSPRFPQTCCSQCGGAFGPGDHGFSHCENHKGIARVPDWQEVYL